MCNQLKEHQKKIEALEDDIQKKKIKINNQKQEIIIL